MKRKTFILILVVVFAVSVALLVACDRNGPQKYTVTFEENGGSEVQDLELLAGENIPVPQNPTKEHFTFEYWCGDAALTSRYVFGVMPAQDIVLYAKWLPEKAVRITFESNGGTAVQDVIAPAGGAISAPAEPTREGYSFAGWYKDKDLKEYFDFAQAPNENITLYARWIVKQGNVLVDYVVNGVSVSTKSVESGTKIAPLELDQSLVLSNWYADDTYTTVFNFDTAISKNTTLYALAHTDGLTFDGGAVTGYTGQYDKVVVPSIYNGVAVTSIAERAFYKNNAITQVELPATITSIGNYAFYECKYLQDVNLSKNVKTIGDYAFYNNVRLESVGDTTGITAINKGVFLGCAKLSAITLSENVQKVSDFAFADCASLTEITLPNTVSAIGDYAFSGCSSITSFTIPRSLSTIGSGAFEGCINLTKMSVASGNTKYSILDRNLYTDMQKTLVMYLQADKTDTSYTTRNETKILEGAFSSRNLLKSITIGQNVTEIEMGALKNMQGLEELTIPYLGDGDENLYLSYIFGASSAENNGMTGKYTPSTLRKVTITGSISTVPEYAFYGCTGLQEIAGIDNVTSYGSYAFSYTALKTFNISQKVTSIGQGSSGVSAFSACYSLESVTVDAQNSVYASYDGCIYDKSLKVLHYVPSAKLQITFAPNVNKIASYAFANSDITAIEVPDTVLEIEFRALYNANSLTYLKLPFIGGSRTANRYLLYLFGGSVTTSNGTTRVTNSNLVPGTLEKIDYYGTDNIPGYAFAYCAGLKTVTYGDDVTEIGEFAFLRTALDEVALGNGVTSIGNFAFAQISTITSVVVPGRIQNIGMGAFGYNRNVTTVTIEEGVTEIGYGAFISYSEVDSSGNSYYYSNLTEINIPASVTKIGDVAFDGAGRSYNSTYARHLFVAVTVNIAENSKLKEVGYGAFAESGITSITLPATLESLGGQVQYDEEGKETADSGRVFLSCPLLKTVVIGNATEGSALKHIGRLTFGYCTTLSSLTIYKDVQNDSDVPTLETAPLSTGARANIFYGGAEPTINVFGADIYKANEHWSSFDQNIYEIKG